MRTPLFFLFLICHATADNTATSGDKSSSNVASYPENIKKVDSGQDIAIKRQYKIAIFAPYTASSQVLFNKRVAEELVNVGHDVTIYMLIYYQMNMPKMDFHPRIKLIPVNGSFGMDGAKMLSDQAKSSFHDLPIWSAESRKLMNLFGELYRSCKIFVKDEKFLSHIEESKYDIAFTHIYNYCPIGIIHKTNIPTWIWLSSAALPDNIASAMGVPLPPSYCTPMMMDAGDKLSFIERIKSSTGHILFNFLWKRMTAHKDTAVFREQFGEDFPDLTELAAKAPLVMVNSNELYDFARPTLSKIVNIGGLGIKSTNAKPLKPEFSILVDKAKGVVVMSFGSFAPMYLMPDHWKEAYFHAFAQFPDVQFFLRYEKPEEIKDVLPPNVYAVKWLPQTDLLLHPKALGLISHGGYNSIQEVLNAGVPILATGLFGDQLRNAHLIDHLGMGINLPKSAVSKETMVTAIRRLIEDKSLKENAQRIKAMIATKPVSAENLLVRWTEFLAQHKKLDNLVPYGTQLSLFVYHSLDVFVFLSAVIISLLVLFFFIIRFSLKCCGFCTRNTTVTDKKKKQNILS